MYYTSNQTYIRHKFLWKPLYVIVCVESRAQKFFEHLKDLLFNRTIPIYTRPTASSKPNATLSYIFLPRSKASRAYPVLLCMYIYIPASLDEITTPIKNPLKPSKHTRACKEERIRDICYTCDAFLYISCSSAHHAQKSRKKKNSFPSERRIRRFPSIVAARELRL